MCNEQWIDLHRMDMMNLFMHLIGKGAVSWANLQNYIIFIQFQEADDFSGDGDGITAQLRPGGIR